MLAGIYSPTDWERVINLLVNVGFDVMEADRFSGEIHVRVK